MKLTKNLKDILSICSSPSSFCIYNLSSIGESTAPKDLSSTLKKQAGGFE
jgi:hypothetical protein